jgi:hypothetical protein
MKNRTFAGTSPQLFGSSSPYVMEPVNASDTEAVSVFPVRFPRSPRAEVVVSKAVIFVWSGKPATAPGGVIGLV